MTRVLSWIFSLVALAAVGWLVGIFAWQSGPVWRTEGLGYLTGARWFFRQHEFGALAMIYGSFVVSLIALIAQVLLAILGLTFLFEPGTLLRSLDLKGLPDAWLRLTNQALRHCRRFRTKRSPPPKRALSSGERRRGSSSRRSLSARSF